MSNVRSVSAAFSRYRHFDKYFLIIRCDDDEKRAVILVLDVVPDSPKITLAPRDLRVVDGGVVSFFCKASGNPAPDVYWRKAGRRITSGRQRYIVVDMPHGSVLRLEPVKSRRDDSVVECVADNGIGEPAVASAKLEIYPEEQCTCYCYDFYCCITDCNLTL